MKLPDLSWGTKNPLGIIALFISLIYGSTCLVLATGIRHLECPCERLPLLWFIILFPVLVLMVFMRMVTHHHKKLYSPSDFKDEKNFNITHYPPQMAQMGMEVSKTIDKMKSISESENNENSEIIKEVIEELNNFKKLNEQIPISNSNWILNHWGSDCASILRDKMIFKGKTNPYPSDGSHINLKNIFTIGKTYEISCECKADINTTGKFQLWCHDDIEDGSPKGINVSTEYRTPSMAGEIFKVPFTAMNNSNIRIHFQYETGSGMIQVSNLRIIELP